MNRAQKEEQLAFLQDALKDVRGLVLTSVKGLTVGEVSELRRQLHDAGIHYKVVKNTLAKKAIEGTDLSVLADDFKAETAIAWSNTDAVTPAKVIVKFKKDVEKFTVKAGYASGERLDAEGVETLSKLPSLDELRSKILGLLQAVPTKLVQQINAPAQNIVGVVAAQKKKLEEAA
jgi:large subunit ribosomal protein L10